MTHTTASKVVLADNTKVDSRDDKAGALTPLDRGNDQADRDTTQAIRKAVTADDTLSSKLDFLETELSRVHGLAAEAPKSEEAFLR